MHLTRIAAATLIAGSLTFAGSGLALADTLTPTAGTTIGAAASAVSEPGVLMLSTTQVKPGQSITFSGTVATPTTATGPVTVSSAAFAGPAAMDRTDPTAFSGSATVAGSAKPGTYTVTASSAAGTVTARLTVLGSAPVPHPNPAPIHHGSTGTGTGTHVSGHGASSGTGTQNAVATDGTAVTDASGADVSTAAAATGSDTVAWVLGGVGVIALAGGGAYAIGRRRSDRATAAAGEQDREPRTEVMNRR